MTFLASVIVFGLLIVIHEAGHFLVAKWCNVGVVEFAVGFGKELWAKKIGETRYALRLIPLGGYVRMIGDDPRDLEEVLKDVPDEQKELYADESRWFLKKGLAARSAIVFAGPFFNLVLAYFLFVGTFYYYGRATPSTEAIIGDTIRGMPAEKAGFLSGDKILSLNGQKVGTWREMAEVIEKSGGSEIRAVVSRPSKGSEAPTELELVVEATSENNPIAALEGRKEQRFKIGLLPDVVREEITFGRSLIEGGAQCYYLTKLSLQSIWGLLTGWISTREIAGPISIVQEVAHSAGKGMEYLLGFTAFLSLSLAVLNLLPIPVLDGGHLLFFAIEALFRRPINKRVLEYATRFGMIVLLLLMMVAFTNDFRRVGQALFK